MLVFAVLVNVWSNLDLWEISVILAEVLLFCCVAEFALVRAIGLDVFISARIARQLFLLCAGITLTLTLFGNVTLFVNFARVTVLLFTGYLVTLKYSRE